MAIAGGAVVTPLRGVLVDVKRNGLVEGGMDLVAATSESATFGYWVLFPCYLFILYYGVKGHKAGLAK